MCAQGTSASPVGVQGQKVTDVAPFGQNAAFEESKNAVKAMIVVLAKQFPQDAEAIEAFAQGYIDTLCGVNPHQRPLLTAEQILTVAREVTAAWQYKNFPVPGKFKKARDEEIKHTKFKPAPVDESTQAWQDMVYAAKKWVRNGSIEVMADYWNEKGREAFARLPDKYKEQAKARVVEIKRNSPRWVDKHD